MGLDQYVVTIDKKFWEGLGSPNIEWEKAYRTNVLNGKDYAQFDPADYDKRTSASNLKELYYFRKHADLQGFMHAEFEGEGGEGDFNCQSVILTAERLDKLEKAVKERSLPHTTGFFFGASDESDVGATLSMISEARKAIEAGKIVFYDSWW